MGVRAVQVVQNGAPLDVIEVRDIAVPEVGPGEVLVAVSAASVNFGDIARTRGGVATVQMPPPFTLGMDVCGVVQAAGDGAESWIGRRVVAMAKQSFGGMAEFAVCAATGVFDAPPELDDLAAAGFLLPFHTSYVGLHRRARLQAGESLLVVGAASSVGTAAMQLGVVAGAKVIALAGGAAKGKYCTDLGASTSIDYLAEDIRERVKALTGGKGADVIYDPVGGDVFDASLRCVAFEGRILVIGFAGGRVPQIPANHVMVKNVDIIGVNRPAYDVLAPEVSRRSQEQLLEWLAQGRISPLVSKTFPLERAVEGLESVVTRKSTGKVVITP